MLLRVLIVEDNPADVYLLKEALSGQISCEFHVEMDGDAALDYLERHGGNGGANLPDLIVLDLNLPRKDGIEVLEVIRRNPELETIPVAVVSSSPRDVAQRQGLRADCYVTKPSDLDTFLAVGKTIIDCWRRVKAVSAGA
jgi:CheY-like chemotaxis protein